MYLGHVGDVPIRGRRHIAASSVPICQRNLSESPHLCPLRPCPAPPGKLNAGLLATFDQGIRASAERSFFRFALDKVTGGASTAAETGKVTVASKTIPRARVCFERSRKSPPTRAKRERCLTEACPSTSFYQSQRWRHFCCVYVHFILPKLKVTCSVGSVVSVPAATLSSSS
jgi:hypothetical protein